MRIVSFGERGAEQPGLLAGDSIIPLAPILEAADMAGASTSALIGAYDSLRPLLERAAADPPTRLDPAELRLGPPVPRPENIVGVGVNYPGVFDPPDRGVEPDPLFFARPRGALAGPRDVVVHPADADAVVYEVELAAIVGTGGRNIPVANAGDHIFGYMVVNDLTALDVLFAGRLGPEQVGPLEVQLFKAKAHDTTLPSGPCVVTADELGDPSGLELRLTVNGRTCQRAHVGEMRRSADQIVAAFSRFMTLSPGDIVLTGAPPVRREDDDPDSSDPRRFVRPGDVVEASIAGIGAIRNEIRASDISLSPPQAD